jgi:hypothetical protein
MTCHECLSLLEEDLDNKLEGRLAGVLSSHLAVCPDCTREYEMLRRERTIYNQYSSSSRIEVSPAFWSGVARRLEEESNPVRTSHWRILKEWFTPATTPRFAVVWAASLLFAAIGISALVLKYGHLYRQEARNEDHVQETRRSVAQTSQRSGPPIRLEVEGSGLPTQPSGLPNLPVPQKQQPKRESGSRASGSIRAEGGRAVQELVEQAEQKYLAAIRILSRDVKKRGPDRDPELHERMEKTLALIDRTIADTRQAVRQRPTDPDAVRYMLTAYAKKVEVLQEMASY